MAVLASKMAFQTIKMTPQVVGTTPKASETAMQGGATGGLACTRGKMAGIESQRVRYSSFQAYFTTETPRARKWILPQRTLKVAEVGETADERG